VLQGVVPLLAPGGFIVVSIPNIAHGAVRLSLLQGDFTYRPLGLLDSTHLRFFTHDSLEEFLSDAGFVPVEVRRTTAGIFQTEIPLDKDRFSDDLLTSLYKAPETETYQFVVRAIPAESSPGLRELYDRLRAQEQQIARMRAQISRVAEQVGPVGMQIGICG